MVFEVILIKKFNRDVIFVGCRYFNAEMITRYLVCAAVLPFHAYSRAADHNVRAIEWRNAHANLLLPIIILEDRND